MAGGKKIATSRGAWICFEDEAGQTLRPPKARTWGRRGQTPVISVSNLAADGIDHLATVVKNRLKRIQYRPELTDAFFTQTGLNLDPEPP